jgi:hypothetical protein
MEMSVISGTRRPFKELVDGTLIMQIEIDPRFRDEAMKLFSKIDMPVAIAPLVADFERREPDKSKPGPLCIMACNFCDDPVFWEFAGKHSSASIDSAEDAKQFILIACAIDSRKELDSEPLAAGIFHMVIREPFLKYKGIK